MIEARTETGSRPGVSWLEFQDLRRALAPVTRAGRVPDDARSTSARPPAPNGPMACSCPTGISRCSGSARPPGVSSPRPRRARRRPRTSSWSRTNSGAIGSAGRPSSTQTVRVNGRDLRVVGVDPRRVPGDGARPAVRSVAARRRRAGAAGRIGGARVANGAGLLRDGPAARERPTSRAPRRRWRAKRPICRPVPRSQSRRGAARCCHSGARRAAPRGSWSRRSLCRACCCCCSWPCAATRPTCCWPAPASASAKWACGWPSAAGRGAWRACCCSRPR